MDKASIPIATLADRFIASCRSAGMTPKTLRGYREKLGRFVRVSGSSLGEFSIDQVRQHMDRLRASRKWEDHPYKPSTQETLSPTSIRNHARVLTSFSSWLEEEGYTDHNTLKGLKIPRANEVRMEPLSDDEITRVMACFDMNLEVGCRNAAMIWLFLDTGLRCAELVSLEMENLFLDTRRLKIMGKGRKERIVPFGHQARRLLQRYIHHLRPEPVIKDRVFLNSFGCPITENTVKMVIQRAARRAEIPRLHVHLLRHTFATRFVLSGGDTMWLQTVMGHERLETTQRYIKRGALQQIVLERALSPVDAIALPRSLGMKLRSQIRSVNRCAERGADDRQWSPRDEGTKHWANRQVLLS